MTEAVDYIVAAADEMFCMWTTLKFQSSYSVRVVNVRITRVALSCYEYSDFLIQKFALFLFVLFQK